jgi:hypothetical protein
LRRLEAQRNELNAKGIGYLESNHLFYGRGMKDFHIKKSRLKNKGIPSTTDKF